jgi:hypothetical protein
MEAVILGCYAVWFGSFIPTFRTTRKTPLLSNQSLEAADDFSFFFKYIYF